MSICPNCKSKLSCGCQKRTASDGLGVCSNCLPQYEAQLKASRSSTPPPKNAPSNVSTVYNGLKPK
jgi:hypothetical protein